MGCSIKKWCIIIASLFIFFNSYAQNTENITTGMLNAVKDNSTHKMSHYIDDFVIVTINNVQEVYSHNQALVVLHDFLDKNDPTGLAMEDAGRPDASSSFIIGNYATTDGNKFTVYILVKLKAGKYTLQEIRINADQ